MKDVMTYLAHLDTRSLVMHTVRRRLEEIRPHVVVAHSLGTVVTLDVLAMSDVPQPTALITIGSPIGIPSIRKQLPVAATAWMASPQSAWLNIYDPTDEITGGSLIDSYPGQMLTSIVNLAGNNDQSLTRVRVTHNLTAYLQHRQVAEILAYLATIRCAAPAVRCDECFESSAPDGGSSTSGAYSPRGTGAAPCGIVDAAPFVSAAGPVTQIGELDDRPGGSHRTAAGPARGTIGEGSCPAADRKWPGCR